MPKHMSPAALAANRANAQKSTGPRTPEGKAKVSRNAVSHGLLAADVIPDALAPYESREEYDALLASLRAELRPASTMEDMLVESIAASHWRLRRLLRVEAGLIARRQDAVHRDDAFGMPSPHPGIAQLTAALAGPIDLPTLRAIFVIPGAQREGYPDAAIVELARGTLSTLQRQHEAALARWRQVAELEASLPSPEATQRLGRYAGQLNRQIHSALRALRELQAQRAASPSEDESSPEAEPRSESCCPEAQPPAARPPAQSCCQPARLADDTPGVPPPLSTAVGEGAGGEGLLRRRSGRPSFISPRRGNGRGASPAGNGRGSPLRSGRPSPIPLRAAHESRGNGRVASPAGNGRGSPRRSGRPSFIPPRRGNGRGPPPRVAAASPHPPNLQHTRQRQNAVRQNKPILCILSIPVRALPAP